jgi:hypothetical protein
VAIGKREDSYRDSDLVQYFSKTASCISAHVSERVSASFSTVLNAGADAVQDLFRGGGKQDPGEDTINGQSDKDDWNKDTSVFDNKIMFKSNLLFVVEDTMNNKYGYYFNGTIKTTGSWIKGKGSFLFSLKSNGRVNGMHKFEEKDGCNGFYLYDKTNERLFETRYGFYLYKENQKTSSYVYEHNAYYDFHGITKAFHPDAIKDSGNQKYFVPKRFVVIQMK